MNENRYTRTVDSIRAPQKTVQAMLDTVHSYEQKETENRMKPIWKTVLAASLAVVLLLGAVFVIPALGPKDNPFTLSVNAAEISDKEFVPIGTLDSIGGDWTTDDKTDRVVMKEFFEFNVRLEGESIDRVVYTIGNGYFGCSGDDAYAYEEMLDQTDVVASRTDEKNYTCLWLSGDSWDSSLPEEARQAIRDWNDHANVKLDQPTLQPDYDDSRFDIVQCTEALYSALLDRLTVGVEIAYQNGQVDHKTLVFACDSVDPETGIAHISAKIA